MASSSGTSPLKGRWTIWIIALVFSLLAGFGVLTIIGQAAEQKIYYVVTEEIPARVAITPENTTAVTTSADGWPPTALLPEEVESGLRYTLVPLKAEEIVTISNTGPLERITDKMPSDFVAVSISVAPENAVGGRIRPGDYVDIAAVAESFGSPFAKVVLSGIQVLDVSVSPSSIAGAATNDTIGEGPGPDTFPARDGIPQLYTFAVSLEDFAKLALLRDKSLYLALSRQDENPNINKSAEAYESEIFGPGGGGGSDFEFEEEITID